MIPGNEAFLSKRPNRPFFTILDNKYFVAQKKKDNKYFILPSGPKIHDLEKYFVSKNIYFMFSMKELEN